MLYITDVATTELEILALLIAPKIILEVVESAAAAASGSFALLVDTDDANALTLSHFNWARSILSQIRIDLICLSFLVIEPIISP